MILEEKKKILIDYLVRNNILKTKKIIKAFKTVQREKFVLPKYKTHAYIDEPLPILDGQTISQPTTIAIMTEALEPKTGQKILEIGAGSGYQAAILSKVVGARGKIYTIERLEKLYKYAKRKLRNYKNVKVIHGDGSKGYEERAPFDRIIVTAAAPKLPEKLFDQLKENGVLIAPVGSGMQQRMLKIRKIRGKKKEEDLGSFVFVPLVGEFGH
ncbi:protein-L-isoaspartate(D-aspartate) O-methyltransferase [Candidatus Woesearchaeota archaeon]|nr:protein-L-isoaspartate(D-aspartate) O-methyltransferase [Candidatus Woesearchaeota archaeon]